MPDQLVKVLLVEDNAADAEMTSDMLAFARAPRCVLTRVARLDEALALIAAQRHEIVLLDLGLPGVRGVEGVRTLRAAAPDAAIIVLSGIGSEGIAVQALEAGAQDYLVKGRSTEDALQRSIRFAMARREADAVQRRFAAVIESCEDAILTEDLDTTITSWNAGAERLYGYTSDEAIGRRVSLLVAPERQRDEHEILARVVAGERVAQYETVRVCKDGTKRSVAITVSPIRDGYGGVIAVSSIARDITERTRAATRDAAARQRAQEQLALVRDQALEASRMKSMFVANVSHEIRTPMNGVIGMAGLLLDTALDQQQREYAETISSSGEVLLEIIDDILDLSKIEAGKLALDPTDIDPRDAIERACGMLALRAHRKALEFVVAIDPDMPALVHADGARLRQVIANLVSNAIKFTEEGEVVVRATTTPTHGRLPLLRIEVSDTGIGIDRMALDGLFKPFSQADSSTTRRYGGTGLGLAISRQLIEMMGGTLGAESEPGVGSRFWLALPLQRVADGGRPPQGAGLEGIRVLVVDDNATNRGVLDRQLSSWQMRCDTADGAAHALELFAQAARAGSPYALALLDLGLPDVDGCVLAERIRALPTGKACRLVLLSPADHRRDPPTEAVLDGVLTKPVRQSRLHEELRAVIAGERADPRRLSPAAAARRRPTSPPVLIVEDTPVNQLVASHLLEKCGFRPHVAANGRLALDALEQGRYVAVLMDCQMPELDGYATTREIRRREHGGARVPIIAMTANSMTGERERCLDSGMDDYLTKPLRTDVLRDTLARWVPARPRQGARTGGVAEIVGGPT